MVEEFKKSYKNGFEVMLKPEERDLLVEYINKLEHEADNNKSIIEALTYYNKCQKEDIRNLKAARKVHQALNGTLRKELAEEKEKNKKAIEYLKSISMDKTPDYIPLKDYKEYHILLDILKGVDKE